MGMVVIEKQTSSNNLLLYPLLIISLCAGFQFYKYVLQVYPSIITTELMQAFQLNGAGLGNLAGTFYYSFIISQLFAGLILDKFGARVAALAIFISALGIFLFAHAHSAGSACLARSLIGIGVAFSTIVYMKMAAVWFAPKYYAFISGLIATATMAGAVFGEIPLSHFIHLFGWRSSLSMLGVAGFVLAFLFMICVRDKATIQDRRVSFTRAELKKVITNKYNWLLTLYGGLTFAPISIFGGLWGNPFLKQVYHFSETQAASMISLIFIGLGLGSPIIGLLAERLGGRMQVMFYSTLLASLAVTLILAIHPLPLWMLGGLLFLFGFGVSGYILVFGVGKDLNSMAVTGTVIAMINAGDAFLTGITEPIIGGLLDMTWSGSIVNGVHHFSIYGYQIGLGLLPIFLCSASLIIFSLRHIENKLAIKENEQLKFQQA